MVRRVISVVLIIAFVCSGSVLPVCAQQSGVYSEMAQYSCQIGLQYLRQGRIEDALRQFEIALVAQPDYEAARCYIREIEKMQREGMVPVAPDLPGEIRSDAGKELERLRKEAALLPGEPLSLQEVRTPRERAVRREVSAGRTLDREELISDYLDTIEPSAVPSRTSRPPQFVGVVPAGPPADTTRYIPPKEIYLTDESLAALKQPVELEIGTAVIVRGMNISRFLVTQPDIVEALKQGPRELRITAKKLGYTYVHIWENDERKTLEFLVVPARPVGLTLAEELREQEEFSRNFIFDYSVDWSLYETGRRIDELDRETYSWRHYLSLRGDSPYGEIDSAIAVNSQSDNTDVSYYTLGLTKGKYGPFRDFSLRAFDFNPAVDSLVYGGSSLRGFMLKSPVADKRFDYTAFWGSEGGGIYRGLSPGFADVNRDSYLSGLNVRFHADPRQRYEASVFQSYGDERADNVNDYGYGFKTERRFDAWMYDYDLGYDSERFAHLMRVNLGIPRFRMMTEFRDTPEEFTTMTGLAGRAGEIGALSNLYWRPTDKLNLDSRIDIYRDRLFPNEDDPDRWNKEVSGSATYQIDDTLSFNADAGYQDNMGKLSPSKSYEAGTGLYKTWEWINRLTTYANYRYYELDSRATNSLDYSNQRIFGGLRTELVNNVFYYLNGEYIWVDSEASDDIVGSRAYETGLEWVKQFVALPVFANLRLTYRDEEDAESEFSFLSGQDYLEGYLQLTYRPKKDTELYFNTRMRNIWADNPDVEKRMDFDFYAGMRYQWDTGVRWESVGDIAGFVFKDMNADGLKQNGEEPVEGVKVWLGKDRMIETADSGYFVFRKVRARSVAVSLDVMSIPTGFTPTGPVTQEVGIDHGKTVYVDFGLATRIEVSGVVFEDVDGDMRLSAPDAPIRGVVLRLDGQERTTDDFGRYSFRHLDTGVQTITVEINSIPVIYLPMVPLKKDFEFFEGSSFQYNIPLKKTK